MNLAQLECPLDLQYMDELSAFLEEDALSVTWFEKDPQTWIFQALCNPDEEASLKNKIEDFLNEKGLKGLSLSCNVLPQKDWVEAVYQVTPPLNLGKFYIYGSHIQKPESNDLIPLLVGAATAFGSGQHESTEGCLKALTLLSNQRSFEHPLDMGCGSGILAMAMAKLWNVEVLGCDNDPEAVRVTLENAELNHIGSLIKAKVSEGFDEIKGQTFDIITANILAGPLCQMAGDAANALRPNGHIVLAGLLNRQAEDVIDAYRSQGLKLFEQLFIGDWSTLILRKASHG